MIRNLFKKEIMLFFPRASAAVSRYRATKNYKTNQQCQNDLLGLPDEMIIHVLSFLNDSERAKADSLCKRIRRLNHDKALSTIPQKAYKKPELIRNRDRDIYWTGYLTERYIDFLLSFMENGLGGHLSERFNSKFFCILFLFLLPLLISYILLIYIPILIILHAVYIPLLCLSVSMDTVSYAFALGLDLTDWLAEFIIDAVNHYQFGEMSDFALEENKLQSQSFRKFRQQERAAFPTIGEDSFHIHPLWHPLHP
ncbi:F-box protein [Legionella jordanis]|nr:F-box protein [Legionella jordanis]